MADAVVMAKPGDFVGGRVHGGGDADIRQAVFVRDNGDGTVYAMGSLGAREVDEPDHLNCDDEGGYLFDGPAGLTVVRDDSLFGEAKALVEKVRADLGLPRS